MSGRRIIKLEEPFTMQRGGSLAQVELAYETWGRPNAARDNGILLFTGLSPSAHAASSAEDPSAGWWEDIVGPGRPLDSRRYYIICVNSLGSCFGSTGPASIDPATGERYRLTFPVLSLEDIANSAFEVVKRLDLQRLHAVVGSSMGGMSALVFTILHPGVADALVSISAAARSLPFAIALRSLQREMIRRDPAWMGGNYPPGQGPIMGMRMARKLGMITYRSAIEWEQRFGRERVAQERNSGDPFGIDFEVEAYLQHHAEKFTGQFDANCYLYLSRAMDLFDIADHGGSLAKGLAGVGVNRVLIAGVETDILFPLKQQRELAERLRGAGRDVEFRALPSIQGHDSFLVDMENFRPMLGQFFGTV